MKETRISLNETNFTNLCKRGFFPHQSAGHGRTDVYLTKADMKELMTGKIIEKNIDEEVIKIALQDIGSDLITEIVKRSPIYSDIYYANL